MKRLPHVRHVVRWSTLTLMLILSISSVRGAPKYVEVSDAGTPLTLGVSVPLDYPADPVADIVWSGGTSGVADIQAAFNNARSVENGQLGTSTPSLTMPSQTEWDSLSEGEKALWLINRERIDRGVAPLHGVEINVTDVAQSYAQYLLDNDTWGHYADGNSPWDRLENNPAINACHDFLNVAENLAVFVTTGSSIPLPIERSIYMWMYDDSNSSWGHRHAILWYPYNDNSGESGKEGFLGIGRANGGPYQGPFTQSYNFAELIVMNVFDPCASWDYGSAPAPTVSSLIPNSGANSGTVYITNLAGSNFSTMGSTVVELRKVGEASIPATNVSVVNSSQISCDLNLTGAATGSWDVVVINPDGQSGILAGGFSVTGDDVTFDGFVYLPLIIKNGTSTSLHSISGNIANNSGAPLSDVTISDGAGHTTMTDANGNYTLTGLGAGTYNLTPDKVGHTFSPSTRSVSVPPDATTQDFIGSSGSVSTERLVIFEAFLRET